MMKIQTRFSIFILQELSKLRSQAVDALRAEKSERLSERASADKEIRTLKSEILMKSSALASAEENVSMSQNDKNRLQRSWLIFFIFFFWIRRVRRIDNCL
jgi:hypothetical protein